MKIMDNYTNKLETVLKECLGAIKGGWHENDEPEFTQRFGMTFVNRIEKILEGGCDHVWGIKTDNGRMPMNGTHSAICTKCGATPNPFK